MRSLIVAAVQMICQDGLVTTNLEHASELSLQAVQRGAQLILFPEFMSQGYLLTTELWDSAEPFQGPTTSWLCATARRHNIYIGSTFLEVKDGHFLNTFVLAEPSGKIAGAVHKRHPSLWEAYFFKGSCGQQFVETEIGRIGVGICFDNHTYDVASAIAASKIDLMLMPHSYCTPTLPTKTVSLSDIERLNDLPCRVGHLYNSMFGIPVVMCNKSGPWNSPVPNTILGIPQNFRFSGRSLILDSDGSICFELGEEESIAVGKVYLKPDLKQMSVVPKYSRYIYPGPLGREIIRLIEWRGSLNYKYSNLRKQKAGIL